MVRGSCLCGHVTYNLDIDLHVAQMETKTCHCRPCRKITGAFTSLNLTVPSTSFALTNGSLKTVKTTHVDEGFEFSLAFCPECGSPIYAVPHGPGLRDILVIQVGTLDDVNLLQKAPTVEMNVMHRLGWVKEVEGAEQKEKYV
ncbi:uncharacterized protein PV07_06910 [Cladophialophora immunda]|uniref:CENP-V/GFA domain-containing protein n=1 Tax=Cladophialophora immunda TaxID=569365 RepID=A0A0D2C7L9_9EURO|nr:uncharacterized protein PV07_06910 [Cladophialophora immunda]KIW27143.1 hypothetical protein PV07_06910 [Cladophialophora immunda]OQV02131.1 hypothetical protein CLAIMM_07374 [Cladophialophora immunda]